MRGYAFSHFYIKPLLMGVQSNHAICRIRSNNPDFHAMYDDWEANHTTLIYLNGGFTRQMKEIVATFERLDITNPEKFKVPMPFAAFHEDEDTLGGILTAVSIIIPHRYYAAMSAVRQDKDFWMRTYSERVIACKSAMMYEKITHVFSDFVNYTPEEIEFVNFVSRFSLQS